MINFEQASNLNYLEINDLYRKYSNKHLPDIYGKFTFGKKVMVKSYASTVEDSDGVKYLDLTGGLGVANFGHNPQRILDRRIQFANLKNVEIHKNYLNRYLAAASSNLAEILPADLNISFFCNSGAEAVDGALKLSYKYSGGNRTKVLRSDRSFHGKTIGAGSLSYGDNFVAGNARFSFQQIPGVLTYEFNSLESVNDLIENNKNDIYAIFVEPFSCSTLTECSEEFLRGVRLLCSKHNIVLVFDEIYSGFGKCGYDFYMIKYGVIPDVVCLSKALGGGKSSISAYVARTEIWNVAYGTLAGALLHSTTYNSFGEECVTVIEATQMLKQENISERSKNTGLFIKKRLETLSKKFPKLVSEIRGSGSHYGLILEYDYPVIQSLISKLPVSFLQDPLFVGKLITTSFIEEYFSEHKIISAFTSNKEVIWNISPSPIIEEFELDMALTSLEKVFEDGLVKNLSKFIYKNFKI
jgi:putrescine aminotransferase